MTQDPQSRPQPQQPQLQLVLHEGLKFSTQTIHLAGKAFRHCQFDRCTLVMSNAPVHFEGCQFNAVTWRLEYDLMPGDANSINALRGLINLVMAPAQPPAEGGAPAGDARQN
ncbi:MAG: hypothetical protein R3F33_14580 [Planctomycetota bacterium]